MANSNLTENLSFTCEHFIQGQVFYFSVDENNELIKLGDGTYGIVYQVETEQGDKFAVKLFYEPKKEMETETEKDSRWLKKSFERELNIIREIRREIGEEVYNIIESVNATSKFKTSEIYEKNPDFSQIFKDLNVSNYAIVNQKYDCTLKDILEERRNGNGRENNNNPRAGYRWITNSPFNERIGQIFIYLRDIATGIKTLHRAGKCHLDLKPSNIFVKVEGDKLRIVIGDLGSLIDADTPHFRFGTRHYRSPEQKDYFDICDGKVILSAENSNLEKLEIRDRKFEDTIIQEGDHLIFSKLGEYRRFMIKSLDKSDDGKVTIEIKGANLQDKFSQDEITQLVFYKKQSYRTDLFGLGAIAFDLLTGGKSPEQFYDNIRSYDKENQDTDELVFLYNSVANLQSDRPDLALLFRPFQIAEKSAEFADKEIVELILKCMLYRAKKTYYDQWNDLTDNEKINIFAIDGVIKQLEKISENPEIKEHIPISVHKNYIYSGNNEYTTFLTNTFENAIEEIQNLSKPETLPARLLIGFGYFSQLIDLIKEEIRKQDNGEKFFLVNLRPSNISIKDDTNSAETLSLSLRTDTGLYINKEAYHKDLISDYVYAKVKHQSNDPFVSDELAYMRRKITIEMENNQESSSQFQGKYFFADSSPLGNYVLEGDYIVGQLGDHQILGQITEVDQEKDKIKVTIIEPKENNIDTERDITQSNDHEINKHNFIYYKRIDVCQYYFYLAGIYLHQIFFNGLNDIYDVNYPFFRIIKNVMYCNSDPSKVMIDIKDHLDKNDQKNKTKLNKILHDLVSMYLRLSIKELEKSYYKYGSFYADKTNLLRRDIDNLKTSIIKFLDNPAVDNNSDSDNRNNFARLIGDITTINNLDDITINSIPKLSEYLSNEEQKNIELNFKSILKNLIEIPKESRSWLEKNFPTFWKLFNLARKND